MDKLEFLLEKLGFALYVHAHESAEADKAREAVEYLEEKDVIE